jgi:hypothetical protein
LVSGKSTEKATYELTNKIVGALNEKLIVGVIWQRPLMVPTMMFYCPS